MSFWQELGRRKLTEWRLDDSAKEIEGYWSAGSVKGLGPRLELRSDSITDGECVAKGVVVAVNRLDDLRKLDKAALLDRAFCESKDGPTLACAAYCDLKRQRYVYWFGFPARVLEPPVRRGASGLLSEIVSIEELTVAYRCMCWFFARLDLGGKVIATGPLEHMTADDLVCCVDPAAGEEPGWPAREAVARAVEATRGVERLRLALLRGDGKEPGPDSRWIEVFVTPGCVAKGLTGWELNTAGRPGPRSVELGQLTDPAELAAQASALNLHLMRWRLLPELKLDVLAQTRCLLIGAGTLGCNVARMLAGWGVRHITFVDYGRVSYSNPARQPLYTVADCAANRHKAEAAAEAMASIAPASDASYRGVVMQVPMPGRALEEGTSRRDFEELHNLVHTHDAIFILTDTREARWLPTVLALAAPNRPTILNVALGLDSFVVLRHGASDETGDRLGCYFCNDVAAPGDSSRDLTLDQQCTVSRPGLAPMASAIAVELLVALLHHPQKHNAPADPAIPIHHPAVDDQRPLGILPHSIRGFLSHFATMLPAATPFVKCAACSDPILRQFDYRQPDKAFEFLTQVAQDPTVIEHVSGLTEFQRDIDPDSFLVDDDDDLTTASSNDVS